MTTSSCRFLIVGAGLAGASTAWHLHAQGVDDVILLDKEPLPGMHSSGRNAAMLRERMDHAALQPLARESAAVLRSGVRAPFRPTGGYLLDGGPDDVTARVPQARGTGTFHAGDGVVDVAALLHGYLAGRDVRWDSPVRSLEHLEDGVRVHTDEGVLHAEVVVNAAGAWAGTLGDLPLVPRNRHLFVSAPDPSIDPDAPFVWDLEAGYYLRPESGGWLLCACDETAAAPGAYGRDPEVLEQLGEKLRDSQPALADLGIARGWVGQRTFAADALPVIGFDPRHPRLFHVAGLGGHGVTLSEGVGRLAASLLLGLPGEAVAFDPARLAPTARATS